MKIILTGGGTMGSVMPLLAVAEKLKFVRPATEFLFLGTSTGPEKPVVEKAGLTFRVIPAGKLRRYFSLKNLLTPFWVLGGLLQSLFIIRKFRPDAIVSAGGFVSVPVIWAGWLLRVPSMTHQSDVRPGLANLLMSRFVKKITVTFEESLKNFPKNKTIL
ncbi:MAG: glycosyltransferase, partial [bacterium]